jgi:hypothetical protein
MTDKKAEAIKRMKLMKLMPEIIEQFEQDNVVHYSETMGILYWLPNKPKWVEKVKEFEEKYKCLVYHAEYSRTEIGDLLTLFYVSDHKDEWERDRQDLVDQNPLVYVWNMECPFSSEFGCITFKSINGGVKRTG